MYLNNVINKRGDAFDLTGEFLETALLAHGRERNRTPYALEMLNQKPAFCLALQFTDIHYRMPAKH